MEDLEPISEYLCNVLCPRLKPLYEIIKCARHNKNQCQDLWSRVILIDEILKGKKTDPELPALKKFDALAKEITKYVKKFNRYSSMQSFYHSVSARERFDKFDRDIDQILQVLSLQFSGTQDNACIEDQSMKKQQKDFTADIIEGIMEVISPNMKVGIEQQMKAQLNQIFLKVDAFGMANHPINEVKKIDLSSIEHKKEEEATRKSKNYKIYKGTFYAFPVLIKRFTAPEFNSNLEQNEKLAMKEAKNLRQFDHPNIIRFYGIIMEKQGEGNFFGIVMEYCSKGPLSSLLQSEEDLSWKLRVHMAQDGASALYRLHSWSSPFVHKRVTSQSFLVNENNSLKLTDFEFARSCTYIQRKTADDEHSSLMYLAPENIDINAKCTTCSDVYSFGVVMWEIATRKIPHADEMDNKTIDSFKEKHMEDMPADCPGDFQSLVKGALKKDPSERPLAKDLVESLMDLHEDMMTEGL